ncbi:MAG: hypothetical protein Q4E01_05760 [Actinomycetaceae bacterium]|nr:hypothetical protein [Actinomycetaceae bacterium]
MADRNFNDGAQNEPEERATWDLGNHVNEETEQPDLIDPASDPADFGNPAPEDLSLEGDGLHLDEGAAIFGDDQLEDIVGSGDEPSFGTEEPEPAPLPEPAAEGAQRLDAPTFEATSHEPTQAEGEPAPLPEPIAEPLAQPVPTPVADPKPTREPTPVPEPEPQPGPAPTPAPAPEPEPAPTPAPAPEPP